MSDKKKTAKAVALGTLCSFLGMIILTCLCAAAIVASGVLPSEILEYIMLGILCFGTMLGGFISALITKSAGLLVGMMTGLAVFLTVTLIGISNFIGTITLITLLRLVFSLIFGGVGGVLGVNKKEKVQIK